MKTRALGLFNSSDIGFGCMNVSHAYGPAIPEADAIRLLNASLDAGYTMLDSAALYGFGANETLLHKAVMQRRAEFILASKGGMFKNAQGVREINGRPEALSQHCEDSLKRLGTEVIDLYYLHRWDKNVPIEDSVGALADLVQAGKIRSIGLSEVSAATLRKAHAVHPITAVQSEYSLWTRNPEIAVLPACRELGVTFIAFSPLGRGYLTGQLQNPSTLSAKDIRHAMPRFEAANYAANLALLQGLQTLATEQQYCSLAQLALAWVLSKDSTIIALPGTTSMTHMQENAATSGKQLSAATLNQMETLINRHTIKGERYNAETQEEIDTEEYA